MKLIALVTIMIGLATGAFTKNAKALQLVECSTQQPANQQLDCGRKNVYHGQTSIRFLQKHKRAGTLHTRTNLRHAAVYVIKYGKKHIETATARLRPPHYFSWLCIHRYEGAWNSDTGNGYYGGLQMDYDFMKAYGGRLLWTKGTADRWSIYEQMWAAERAYASRGFSPWPNTARACGLL